MCKFILWRRFSAYTAYTAALFSATAVHLLRERVQHQCSSFFSMVRRILAEKSPTYSLSKCSSVSTSPNFAQEIEPHRSPEKNRNPACRNARNVFSFPAKINGGNLTSGLLLMPQEIFTSKETEFYPGIGPSDKTGSLNISVTRHILFLTQKMYFLEGLENI